MKIPQKKDLILDDWPTDMDVTYSSTHVKMLSYFDSKDSKISVVLSRFCKSWRVSMLKNWTTWNDCSWSNTSERGGIEPLNAV